MLSMWEVSIRCTLRLHKCEYWLKHKWWQLTLLWPCRIGAGNIEALKKFSHGHTFVQSSSSIFCSWSSENYKPKGENNNRNQYKEYNEDWKFVHLGLIELHSFSFSDSQARNDQRLEFCRFSGFGFRWGTSFGGESRSWEKVSIKCGRLASPQCPHFHEKTASTTTKRIKF